MRAMRNQSASHIDFGSLVGLIPNNPKFLPSNLDMVYERKGKFLVAEWKRENEEISAGQDVLLRRLAKVPGFTVLIITGNTDEEMVVSSVRWLKPNNYYENLGSSVEDLKEVVRLWYEHADKETPH